MVSSLVQSRPPISDMISSLTLSLLFLVIAGHSPAHTDLVITIKGNHRHSSRHQYHLTLQTEEEPAEKKEASSDDLHSVHPPLTSYTPPSTTPSYQAGTPAVYYREASHIHGVKGPRVRYKPPRYKPGRKYYQQQQGRKKLRSKRRGPPRKRQFFPKRFY